MAINETFFWDGPRYYGQDELSLTWDCFFYSGVRVKENGTIDYGAVTSGNSIVIDADSLAYLGGVFRYEESKNTISCSGHSGTRYLAIRADYRTKNCDVRIVTNSTPIRNGEYYELILYRLSCTGSSVSIVEDLRKNRAYCGYCTAKERSEYGDNFDNLKDRVESWFNTMQGEGWRKIFVQNYAPANSELVDGALWFDTKSGAIYHYKSGLFTRIDSGSDSSKEVFSVIATTQEGVNVSGPEALVPFSHDRQWAFDPTHQGDGRHTKLSFKTDYCHLVSPGHCYIDEDGIYAIDATVNIINTNGIEKFQVGLWLNKYRSSYGGPVLLSENYIVKAQTQNQASGSVHCVMELRKNDDITVHCTGVVPDNLNGDQKTRPYEIRGKETHLTVYKLTSL